MSQYWRAQMQVCWCTCRFPPLRFFGPSFGIGNALVTFDGGGAASLSICFSIFSRNSSPYWPSRRDRSRSIRAANTALAPTVLWTFSWYSGGVCWISSDWNTKPVCRRWVAVENPAVIFFWAPSNYKNDILMSVKERMVNRDLHEHCNLAFWPIHWDRLLLQVVLRL